MLNKCKHYYNYRTAAVLSIIAMLCLGPGCGEKVPESEIIAKVGDTKVTISDFEDRISHLPDSYKTLVKKRKDEFLESIINDTLLYQKALDEGLDKDKDVQRTIEAAKTKILIARYLKDNVDDAVNVTDEDITEEYENNKEKYMTVELMRVSHILVPSREMAREILQELSRGAKFEDVARAKSVDPTAQSGGDIGYFPKGQLMPEFENACAKLEPGQISGIVKTGLGYHIIMLTDRKAPTLKPLDTVKEDIRTKLHKDKKKERFESLLEELKENTKVHINKENLEKAGN